MKIFTPYLLLFFLFLSFSVKAQKKMWKSIISNKDESWFASKEAKQIAENVLLYQRDIGGWPKNIEMQLSLSEEEKQKLIVLKSKGKDATIDNGATTQEMLFLSKVNSKQPDERYRDAFLKGIDYLLEAQYSNGGWPQFYPLIEGYYSDITFNDDAMVNVLRMFKEIKDQSGVYSFAVPEERRRRVQKSFRKGIDCILKTQYLQNGTLTAWCAQYDPVTLKPAKARAYEFPSLSGKESAQIVLLLMSIEKPCRKIRRSVESAVAWFEKTKIEGIKVETFTAEDGTKDRKVISAPGSKPLWARFMDLETNEPFFTDRSGIKRKTLAEISYERRNGYSWYTDEPEEVLKKYVKWKKNFSKK